MLDWSGYDLPRSLINLGEPGQRVRSPQRSGKIDISTGRDTSTGAPWFIAKIDDWAQHRTPLVLEFDADWTSDRGLGSCYVVVPELVDIDSTAVEDARAAATGAKSVFDLSRDSRTPSAITFGRVILRTGGHIDDSNSRPPPGLVDGNPWTRDLGEVGQEAAVRTCTPPAARDSYPHDGSKSPNGRETAPDLSTAAQVGCGGLSVVETRNASTLVNVALLLFGAFFGLALERLVKVGSGAWRAYDERQARTARQRGQPSDPDGPDPPPDEPETRSGEADPR